MATHDYNLANQSGQSFRSDLNNALAAIVSNNSSSTAPATTFAHQIWVDTTANVIKQRNAANDAWVELWRIDGGFNAKTFSSNVTLNAQSDLRFADSDSSNWVAFQAPATVSSNVTWTLPSADGTADQALTTNGSGVLSWADAGGVQDNITEGNTSAEVVDTGSDGHFKVVTEGTEALRVTNAQRVGIGTASPNTILEASTSVNTGGAIRITNPNTGTSANSAFIAHNGTFDCSFGIGGTNYTTYAAVRPNAAFVYCNQANGIGLTADNANGFINFVTGGSTERVRVDNSGRLLLGTTTALDGNMTSTFRGSSGACNLMLARLNAPSDGQSLAAIYFADNQGNQGAVIDADRDGGTWTQGSSHPTRLIFKVTSDNATSPTERMRITEEGFVNINDSGVIYNSDGYTNAQLFVYDVRSGGHAGTFVNNNVNYAQANHGVFWTGCSRSASSSYVLYAGTSGNGNSLNYGSDYEFRLYGDGNGKCDGSWTGGGADYAEMFEWVDGNPNAEDRRGLSVVLEGNKIRAAVDGEDPIGVISANPTILGDAAWNKWTEKHLRDDFGSYVYEEHNVLEWTDEEGKEHNYEDWNIPADVVVPDDAVTSTHDENGKRFTHRAVNPAYDPDRQYVPREERQEWDAVGLMGKLRIRKGQVTGTRWIKMRDISDTVEEWLVR